MMKKTKQVYFWKPTTLITGSCAIGKPERQVRKASHYGNNQQ